jgi:uncharacterized membrane protein
MILMTRKWSFINVIVLIYIGVLGFIFVFLVPPFQKPDEITHWKVALSVFRPNALAEKRFFNMPERFKAQKIAFESDVRFSTEKLLYMDLDKGLVDLSYLRHRLINPFGYLPTVLGIFIGSYFNYPIIAFWLGRLIGLILLMLSLIWSIKAVSDKYKRILIIYAVLPMVAHQVTSINYDVMPLVLVPMIFAFFVRLMESVKVNKWDMWGLVAGIFLFVLAKGGYYFFLILILLGLFKFYPLIIKKLWWVFLLGLGGFAYFGMRIFYVLVTMFWGVGEGLISPKMQYILLGQDRWYLVKIIWNSLQDKWEFYGQSFLGYFGWLDYKYDFWGYLVIVALLVFLLKDLIKENVKPILSKIDLLGLLLMIGGTFGTLMLLLYFTWTTVGAKTVEGMVGRYVLVLFPFVVLVFLELILMIGKERAKKILFGLTIFIIALNSYKAVYKRYYDFIGRFKNENELTEKITKLGFEGGEIVLDKLNKEISFVLGVSPGEPLNGFGLYVNSQDLLSRVPYRYFIKDRDCRKILKSGYLDQEKLKDGGVVIEGFGVIRPKDDALCVVIRPIMVDKAEKYISLGMVDDTYLFNFLVPETEQVYK